MEILILYFLGGFILDILLVYYYYAITEKKVILSFLITFITGVFQTLALYFIVTGVEHILNTIVYAFGCAVGTALIVYLKKNKKYEKILRD
jgi:hypothetical protein